MFTFYTYEVYGFVLKSNIFMPLLPEIGADCAFDVELKVTYDLVEDDSPIKITENSEYFVVDLCPFAVYKVYKKECLIECSARNFTDFFSTFFNIPFSVFLMMREEILFHTNSMICDNCLLCFSGKKGVGKSTLTYLLSTEKRFCLYSDDTLRIDKNYLCYKGNNLIKLTDESIDKYGAEKRTGIKNSVGKEFCIIDAQEKMFNFKYVFQISRHRENFNLCEVNKTALKRTTICSNIVGIDYFCSSLLEKALDKSKKIDVNIFNLYVPDTLEALTNCKKRIANEISEQLIKSVDS